MPHPQKHLRTCNLCEAMCGIEITHDQGHILAIKGDPKDPLSKGHICPKAVALQDLHEDPDRLRYPMLKTPDGWEQISWENAFNEVASRLRNVQAKYGQNAVGIYLGNPTIHNMGSMLTLMPFLSALGTANRFSATSVDQLAPMLVAMKMFGNQLLLPVPDIDRTDLMICLGANPMASNGSLMTAPGFKDRIKALQARGGRFIVIDPRRTESAELADEHHFIRPGTDALLLMAMLHTLFRQDLIDTGRLTNHLQGLNIVKNMVVGFTPQKVARVTGLKARDIRQLAVAFASAPGACFYGRMGASTQEFGTLTNWLITLLNTLTGNLDEPGGVMFTRPAVDLPGLAEVAGQTGSFNSRKSRVRKYPEFGGEFPASTLADEILTNGKGQIKALVTSAGNPVLSLPNGRKVDKALQQLDFMVAIDFYLNETTRHAHIILPPTGPLEHGHYDLVLNMVTVRNTAKYSPPLYKPMPDTRHDWQIFNELTRRLQSHSPLKWAASEAQYLAIKQLGDEGLLNLALKAGPYGQQPETMGYLKSRMTRFVYRRFPGSRASRLLDVSPYSRHTRHNTSGLSLKKLKQYPHGIDLGPLEPCFPERLATQGKTINLVPKLFMKDIVRLQQRLDKKTKQAPDSFALIGRRDVRSNNSWMHNSQRLVKGKNRCNALIHHDDAKRLGVQDGDVIIVSSRVGEIEIPAQLTDAIMPGVLCIPHGWGHNRPGSQLSVAGRNAGVSVNDITDDYSIDAVTGVAAFSGQQVTVSTIKVEKNVVRMNDKRLAASPAS
ncbi:molybdopterin-dependent oxidoreductase [Ketobacter sp.]|uniref:molybdopterin-dependent oxidoreductase n=1 Tax=Ketobacter sp. TaxID=2083498 RepID=UPI000F16AFD9|nr:molybdopterin-dependent oxidoreductase [Ketobacter sp.]RLT94405.1 MAG: molybdopterin oxidoreductase family protein [Ketobacter sp.]